MQPTQQGALIHTSAKARGDPSYLMSLASTKLCAHTLQPHYSSTEFLRPSLVPSWRLNWPSSNIPVNEPSPLVKHV
jgi:hypothetical protein